MRHAPVAMTPESVEALYSRGKPIRTKRNDYPFQDTSSGLKCLTFLPYINLVLILGSVTLFLILGHASPNTDTERKPPLILKDDSTLRVPFNLVPEAGSKTMRLMLTAENIDMKNMERYDVCCRRDSYFVCRSVTRNVGVDCIIEYDKNSSVFATIIVAHSDMIGARCVLYLFFNQNT